MGNMRRKNVQQFDKLLVEIKDAINIFYEDVHICSHVVFKPGFPCSRTYAPTININHNIFITYDIEVQTIDLYNTEEDIRGHWFWSYSIKDYNNMELGIYLYKKINSIVYKDK